MMLAGMIKEAGKEVQEITLVNDAILFGKLVGGTPDILKLPTDRSISIMCNDNGKAAGLKPNFMLREYREVICGNAIFVGNDGTGKFISLTKDQKETIRKYLE